MIYNFLLFKTINISSRSATTRFEPTTNKPIQLAFLNYHHKCSNHKTNKTLTSHHSSSTKLESFSFPTTEERLNQGNNTTFTFRIEE